MEIRHIPHAQKEYTGDIRKHQSHSLYHVQALLFERHNTAFQKQTRRCCSCIRMDSL